MTDDSGSFPRKIDARYEVRRNLARGGFSNILVASDPAIGRRVAVKMLLPELLDDERAVARFSEEAQVPGQLDHPNIVPIYDLGHDGGNAYVVMKLVRGKSLAEILEEPSARGSIDALSRYVRIVLCLCDALAYAHSRGVIHRDLKPGNIMVGDYGQVYLMDWGLALLESRRAELASGPPSHATRFTKEQLDAIDSDSMVRVPGSDDGSNSICGTPEYMAPEQLLARLDDIDARTDVFGIGAILYEVLTGEPPNDAERILNVRGRVALALPDKNELWPRLPPGLCRIVERALADDRQQRYPDMVALKKDLEQYLDGGGWFETRRYAAGAVIVSEGEVGDTAYIIERGRCQVFTDVQGERRLVRELGPGHVFGETAVLTGAPRSATVVASEETWLKLITGDSLKSELDRNPWLSAFVRSLASLFRETDARARSSPPPR